MPQFFSSKARPSSTSRSPIRERRVRVVRKRRRSNTVTPATVVFRNESPDLIDGSENFITYSSAGTLAGAAGNNYRVTLYSNQSSLWKTVVWNPSRVKVAEKTTNGGIIAHIADVNSVLRNYVTAVITGTIPNSVTYSAGTGVGGSFPMTGGVG